MPGAVKCKLLLYADDSALMVSGRNVTEIETTLTVELNSIHKWLVDNKLSLHLGKTNTILFGSKKRIQQNNSIQVKCNGNDIESKQQVTYLGLTLDQSISGNTIADKVVLQCSNKVKFLYRNANKFNMKTKQLLVSALILYSATLIMFVLRGTVVLVKWQSLDYKWHKIRPSCLF